MELTGILGSTSARLKLSLALLLLAETIELANARHQLNNYYPGSFQGSFGGGDSRGYGDRVTPGAGSWHQQGPYGEGPHGGVAQEGGLGYGNNPWSADGQSTALGGAGAGYGPSVGGYNGAAEGGAIGGGPAFGAGHGLGHGYNGQFPSPEGIHPGAAQPGVGRPQSGPGSFGGSFGAAGSGPVGPFGGPESSAADGSPVGGGSDSGTDRQHVGGGPGTRPVEPARSVGGSGLNSAGATGGSTVGAAAPGTKGAAAPAFGANGDFGHGGHGVAGVGAVPNVPATVFGVRPAVPYYGNPHAGSASYPRPYGTPVGFGGHGAGRYPWPGTVGYVYRVPVAHLNPDGSYAFSYHTPHSTREESGHSNGHVDGNYSDHNDGAQHNVSFTAAPDVDLRLGTNRKGSEINPQPDVYGPQSVHSRGRMPFLPQTPTRDSDSGAVPGTSWSNRNGADGATSETGSTNAPNGPDDGALNVLGLPTTNSPAATASGTSGSTESNRNPNEGNRLGVVRNQATVNPVDGGNVRTAAPEADATHALTTLDDVDYDSTDSTLNSLRSSFGSSGEADRLNSQEPGRVDASATPSRSQQPPIEQVLARPENPDRSYHFAYQTPTATREESADREGTVRGSFAYNNEAGRNDLQYLAGSGMGFRPIGGSLAVPNGLPSSAPSGPGTGRGSFSFDNPSGRNGLYEPNGLRTSGGNGGAAGGGGGGGYGGVGPAGKFRFDYRAPSHTDGAGAGRGSFAYDNEAERAGLRPIGGSLSAANGLGVSGGGEIDRGTGPFGFGDSFNNRGGQGGQGRLPSGSGGSHTNGGYVGPSSHSTATRSPQDILPPGRWNTGNGASGTTSGGAASNTGSASVSRNGAGKGTTDNFDDTQQTTTFNGFDSGIGANSGPIRF